MTDIEKFIALYKEFGIELSVLRNDNGTSEITIEVDCCEKVSGYLGFRTTVTFDQSGKFKEQSIYE